MRREGEQSFVPPHLLHKGRGTRPTPGLCSTGSLKHPRRALQAGGCVNARPTVQPASARLVARHPAIRPCLLLAAPVLRGRRRLLRRLRRGLLSMRSTAADLLSGSDPRAWVAARQKSKACRQAAAAHDAPKHTQHTLRGLFLKPAQVPPVCSAGQPNDHGSQRLPPKLWDSYEVCQGSASELQRQPLLCTALHAA